MTKRPNPARSMIATRTLIFIGLVLSLAIPRLEAKPSHAEERIIAGSEAYRQGNLEQALAHWVSAAEDYQAQGMTQGKIDALLRVGQVQQALGRYKQAASNVKLAYSIAERSDVAHKALAAGRLGHAYMLAGDLALAERYLTEGFAKARQQGLSDVLAGHQNVLGELRLRQQQYQRASDAFAESAKLAVETAQPALAAKALVNAAQVAVQDNDHAAFKIRGRPALDQIQRLEDSHDKAFMLLALGRQAQRIARPSVQSENAGHGDPLAYEAFNSALKISERIQDKRAQSYALGYLGELYEQDRRFDEALGLTRRAAFVAQEIDAPEILYLWEWQTGRLLKAEGKLDAAITAYERSVYNLRRMRRDLMYSEGGTGPSFREAVGPVFFELADLLLQRPTTLEDEERIQSYLVKARDTLELLKSAEIEDYFQDDCVTALQSRITRIDKPPAQTAVIYPILLADRTELLLTLPSGIKQFTVPVTRETLAKEVTRLRLQLENAGIDYLGPAQTIYDWLLGPMDEVLRANNVETLVIVPDGPLRTIPMSVLHDGEQYLIQRYAVATTPGITLTDPQPLARKNVQVLLSGLTEAVQDFPALPEVSQELQAIEETYKGSKLLNNDFVVPNVEIAMNTRSPTIVHIATHGQFDRDPSKTFLLTYNDKLTMDGLERLIGPRKFLDAPVELLTLSACQTAVGDDRAALGLAGIAVKAGARSALASLWFISDESTALLMSTFYKAIKNDRTISKAKALQQAQLMLLEHGDYGHPYFWSAFLLIGNWL